MLPAALHPLEPVHFGEYQFQQSGQFEQLETHRGHGRKHDFVEFGRNPFARNDFDAGGVAADGLESFVFDGETQLGRKAHGPHHAQRVVRKGDVGVARRADDAGVQIVQPAERVDQFAEAVAVKRPGQRIDDREVAPPLVVLQRSGLDLGFARIARIGFPPRSHEFHLDPSGPKHRRAESLENRHLGVQFPPQRLGQRDAAAHHHHVDVGRRTAQIMVAHITAHHEGFHPLGIGQARNTAEYGIRQRHALFGGFELAAIELHGVFQP